MKKEDRLAAFDEAAADYDQCFTHTEIGRLLRESVWQYLDDFLAPESRILELGCGTGEDAKWLAGQGHQVLATDASQSMLRQAKLKIEAAGLADRVHFAPLDLREITIEAAPEEAPFDAVFSNFGVLNCLESCHELGGVLHQWLRPGGQAVFVVMPPVCLWEIAFFGLHLKLKTATRRFHDGRPARIGENHDLRVWYPSPRRLRRQFEPLFEHRRTLAIGALTPPTYAASFIRNRSRLLHFLNDLDQRWAHRLPGIADHYLISLTRVDDVSC